MYKIIMANIIGIIILLISTFSWWRKSNLALISTRKQEKNGTRIGK